MKKTMTPRTTLAPDIAKVLKRLHYPLEVMLLCVRWYVAYSLSLRNLEEMMAERDICLTFRRSRTQFGVNFVVGVAGEMRLRPAA